MLRMRSIGAVLLFFSVYVYGVYVGSFLRRVGNVGRMGRGEVHTGFWWGNLRVGDHLEDPSIVGRILLKWVFEKWNVGAWTGSSWLRIGTGGGLL
jgi:hypothetical protein